MNAGATTEDIHPLLAFTNDKEIRDEFISQRDMSLYIEKVSKGMDNDDWKIFANTPDNRGKLLQYYPLNTKYIDEDGNICSTKDDESDKSKAFTILATADEILEMEGVCDNLEACQFAGFISDDMVWSCPWIFKHKLQKALYDLGYETAWKLNTQYGEPQRGETIQHQCDRGYLEVTCNMTGTWDLSGIEDNGCCKFLYQKKSLMDQIVKEMVVSL